MRVRTEVVCWKGTMRNTLSLQLAHAANQMAAWSLIFRRPISEESKCIVIWRSQLFTSQLNFTLTELLGRKRTTVSCNRSLG